MQSPGKVSATVLLSIFAFACATSAAYLFSILSWGHWKYPVAVVAFGASIVLAVIAIAGIAAITTHGKVKASAVRCALLICAYAAASGAFFLLVLANCSLSCGNRILAEARSPDGHWKAVWYLRQCASPARYCPPVSFVSILKCWRASSQCGGKRL
jgi:uncharacterized integral membrane protein